MFSTTVVNPDSISLCSNVHDITINAYYIHTYVHAQHVSCMYVHVIVQFSNDVFLQIVH